MSTKDGFIRSEEGKPPPARPRAPGGMEAPQTRLLRLARPSRLSNSQKKTGPRPSSAPGSSPTPGQTLRPPAASGPGPARHGIQTSTPERPEDHDLQRHDPLAGPGRKPVPPSRPQTFRTGRGRPPQEPRRQRAGSDMGRRHHPAPRHGKGVRLIWPRSRDCIWQKGSPATPVAGHTPYRADQRSPRPWQPGSARRPRGTTQCPHPDRGSQHHPGPGTRNPRPTTGSSPSVGRTGICHTQHGSRPLSTAP